MRAYVIALVLVAVVIAAKIVLAVPRCRRVGADLARQLLTWLVRHLERPAELDELAEEMRQVVRRERLHADVRRVRGLLATDTSMSACRHFGNRMAYATLLDDLEQHVRDYPSLLVNAFDSPVSAATPGYAATSPYQARTPQVEVLEIGWRR